MADDDNAASDENYELVPYREIEELKEQLKHLKDVPIPSSKKLQVSMDDLAAKIDRMTAIFEEAGHEIKTEEGGLTFQEKMKPLFEKLNKVLEQNSEIAKGIVAVADLINELKGRMEEGFTVKQAAPASEPLPVSPTGTMTPPPRIIPPMPSTPPKRKLGFF